MNNKRQLPKSTDVLIVGAGPAGMTLAISLKQLGVDCVVIDQLPRPPDDTRAASSSRAPWNTSVGYSLPVR